MVEGTSLLRKHTSKPCIEGSNPSVSARLQNYTNAINNNFHEISQKFFEISRGNFYKYLQKYKIKKSKNQKIKKSKIMADQKTQLQNLLQQVLNQILHEQNSQNSQNNNQISILLERPKNPEHGDFATNLAMKLAKTLRKKPQEISNDLINRIQQIQQQNPNLNFIENISIAGAGFINFKCKATSKLSIISKVLNEKENFGKSAKKNQKILVEFVSANPTGPLHVGHGRGAAYGASLSNLLEFAGFDVDREYYVNDAGRQMDILAISTLLRCVEVHFPNAIDFPPNAYQGDYVKIMAEQFSTRNPKFFTENINKNFIENFLQDLGKFSPDNKDNNEIVLDQYISKAKQILGKNNYEILHKFVLTEQLDDCKNDLQEFGVTFDNWFSEKSLMQNNEVQNCIDLLTQNGNIYVAENNAKWFKSTDFGDEKNRVVQRDNGIYTYFASDIAYHKNKFQRGYDKMINIWGADHHGYISRVKGALKALNLNAENLIIALVQFAVLYRNGEKAQMSTRSGQFITLRDLRKEVGNDACRFFYVMRKSDQHLDFDLDLAKSQSSDNPVYYIQYAYARIASSLKKANVEIKIADAENLANLEKYITSEKDLALCDCLLRFPEVIETAARDLAPHQIAFYAKNLAAEFHAWYNSTRILSENLAEQNARLLLISAVQIVIKNAMKILGVSCPETM